MFSYLDASTYRLAQFVVPLMSLIRSLTSEDDEYWASEGSGSEKCARTSNPLKRVINFLLET